MDKLVAAIAEVEGLADSLQQTRAEVWHHAVFTALQVVYS